MPFDYRLNLRLNQANLFHVLLTIQHAVPLEITYKLAPRGLLFEGQVSLKTKKFNFLALQIYTDAEAPSAEITVSNNSNYFISAYLHMQQEHTESAGLGQGSCHFPLEPDTV